MAAEKDSPTTDREALDSLDRKLKLVSDRVTAVVHGYQTGLYLCGAGGLGKTYNVIQELKRLGADFRTFNTRMTGKGLFRELEKAPEAVHLLEDIERLTDDRDGQSILRAALWAQPGCDRVVTWTTAAGDQRFTFKGGIIMLANRPLSDLPELRALATRIAVHRLEISEAEMVAQIRNIARGGFARGGGRVGPEEATEVANFVVAECRVAHCPLDLRLFDNSCLDYLQWASAHAACDWHDLVRNRIRQSVLHFKEKVSPLSAEERRERERGLIRQICARTQDAQERVRLWKEATGKSQATFYARKQEAESPEFNA